MDLTTHLKGRDVKLDLKNKKQKQQKDKKKKKTRSNYKLSTGDTLQIQRYNSLDGKKYTSCKQQQECRSVY